MDITKNINRIKLFFQSRPEIIAVYLFGSCTNKIINENSDIDIGIQFEYDITHKQRSGYIMEYYYLLYTQRELDLVDMNNADYPVLYEIFKEGNIIFERNRQRRIQFQSLKMSEYMDVKYFEQLMLQGLIRRVRRNLN